MNTMETKEAKASSTNIHPLSSTPPRVRGLDDQDTTTTTIPTSGTTSGGSDHKEHKSSDVEMIYLISQQMEKVPINIGVARQSALIKTMLEGDPTEHDIPLHTVSTATLRKVVEYMNWHEVQPATEIERPLKSANLHEVVSQWDAEFVDVDLECLCALTLAANYMDIPSLLNLTCAKVASIIKSKKNPEEIRKIFGIVNDFTPEEEEAIRTENKWAEES